jgi:phosphoribosyl 1,2-cyclic phosphodiesterase
VRARIWGCRGSLATPGPATVKYGGNTSCLEVRGDDGSLIVLDAGTGIRALGSAIVEKCPVRVHVLLTHLHVDHIEGFGFFAPVWTAGHEIHLWGPPSPLRTLRSTLAAYLSPPLFPVYMSDAPSTLTFHDIPHEPWEIGGVRIHAEPIEHPGPTVGYRLEHNGHSLAYLPDHEPALGLDLSRMEPDWISGIGLASEVDVLVHDAQWFEPEYESKIGWGHSSVADAVTFARVAGARQLVLWHHDPHHGDAELERLGTRAEELWRNGGPPPVLGREGDEIELD